MNEKRLRDLLVGTPVPGELEALRRNWRIVRAAYEKREAIPLRERRPTRAVVALAVLVALLVGALTPPGQAVLGSLRDAIVREEVVGREPSRPALASLPAPGRLLVVSPRGAWIVHEDGSKRRLGAYRDASWSPRGLFVVAARGRQLVAVDPEGNARWSLARDAPIADPRWASSGFRIAYRSGRSLRVVAGDGRPDRRVTRRVAPVAPAWRPGEANVLAFVDARRRVRVVDVDSGKRLWRSRVRGRYVELEWSADGKRLLALARGSLVVFDRRGRVHLREAARAGVRNVAAEAAPRGRVFALVTRSRATGRSDVWLLGRRGGPKIFSGAGALTGIAWSPDGRWLLLAWKSADQWLFVRSTAVRKVLAYSGISRQFEPGGTRRAIFPSLRGWCCPP